MSKFNDLLHLRFKQKPKEDNKMSALVQKANNGELSSFSGIFRVAELTAEETSRIASILQTFNPDDTMETSEDLRTLCVLTSEVKAITNQAVMLHGERIQKAQNLLKKYREGAFTAWLFATYGNRQTPYNFLQYYEFYSAAAPKLQAKIDQMPRQAIYTLASREGDPGTKRLLVENYQGESKQELLSLIRNTFPLKEIDRRAPKYGRQALFLLKKAKEVMQHPNYHLTDLQQEQITTLLNQLHKLSLANPSGIIPKF
jgi:hypothetical protein